MQQARTSRIIIVTLSALAGTAAAQSVERLMPYTTGDAFAEDINDNGEVVGQSMLVGFGLRPTHWDADGTPTNLGLISGGVTGSAYAINNNGEIVGYTEFGDTSGKATLWSDLTTIVDIHDTIGSINTSVAWDISDSGTIVGQANIAPGIFARGFVWDQANPAVQAGSDRYPGGANYGINNVGVVVGSAFFFGDPDDAMIATPDGRGGYDYPFINPMGRFFSQARAINETGMVVGHSGYGSTTNTWNACIFTGDDRDPVQTLGTLPGLDTSEGLDVNDSGLIVGYAWDGTGSGIDPRAWAWVDGTMYDLNELLDEGGEFEILSRATGVNNNGDIVGWGRLLDGSVGAFLIEGFAPPSDCAADLNGDGMLDFFDVSTFLSAFNAQDPVADFDRNDAWDFFDVSAFLSAFNAGCP
ncbi:MAG: GC-type dockerin domain-anchored protein [Phycisphaerales bacterium]